MTVEDSSGYSCYYWHKSPRPYHHHVTSASVKLHFARLCMSFRRHHHHNSLPTRESEELAKQRQAEELHVSSYFKSKTNIAREHLNLLGKVGEYPCRATVVKRTCQSLFANDRLGGWLERGLYSEDAYRFVVCCCGNTTVVLDESRRISPTHHLRRSSRSKSRCERYLYGHLNDRPPSDVSARKLYALGRSPISLA